jgi:hypothetical protein
VVPGTSGVVRREVNWKRMRPSVSGAGFPMSIECEAEEEPPGKNWSR